ncbi:unnamed protein product [Toxocara canis]|uniref:F-box domain-containing protein n=1 Tax=Toxocara canis TaxID=6265 RepID=A0A183UJD8_TOXCA|nr:unnamed protein product [Toxocara canis]
MAMDEMPNDVLRDILERLPAPERISASFTCRRWLSLLARTYPRTFEICVNLDSSACNAKLKHSSTHVTHITICSCPAHTRQHAIILKYLFEHCGRAVKSVSIDDDLIPKENVQCQVDDLTFHSVLAGAPSTISALYLRGLNFSKIHAWTLALIAKFGCLEEVALCSCVLPATSDSVLPRLFAPSFQSLTSIAVTDSVQVPNIFGSYSSFALQTCERVWFHKDYISDKFVTTIVRRCPLLRDVNVSGCGRVTALSLVAFCESANSRRAEMACINMCSTSFDFKMLERYLCSPLLVGGNFWIATPMRIEIGYERAAVCIENTRFRNLLIIAYV